MKVKPVSNVFKPNLSTLYSKNSLYLFADRLRSMRGRQSPEAFRSAVLDGGGSAREAATGIARIIQSMRQLQNSAVETARAAAKFSGDPDAARLAGSVNRLVEDYNLLNEAVHEHDRFLGDNVRQLLHKTASAIPIEDLAVRQGADLALVADAAKLQSGLAARPNGRQAASRLADSFADSLRETFAGLCELPAEALLDHASPALRHYELYRPDKRRYLHLPKSGMIVDVSF